MEWKVRGVGYTMMRWWMVSGVEKGVMVDRDWWRNKWSMLHDFFLWWGG